MEELFNAVRAACSPSTWSKAVELVRRLSVSGQSAEDDEVICRVKSPTRSLPNTVQLYVEDAEWACDCDSRAACCEHVAAAVIALKKARAEGHLLPQGGAHEARLVYRFTRFKGELSLQRVLLKHDQSEVPLTTTLAHAVATDGSGVSISPSQADVQADRALGQRVFGPLPPDTAVGVLRLLAGARNVEFEGQAVHVGSEVLTPLASVRDAANGFEVELRADPRVTEIVASGIALCGDTLHLLDELHSAGAKWQSLPSVKLYPPEAVATLVTEVLPQLYKRFKVNVQTQKLPQLTREAKPRAVVKVEQEGDRLSALLTLVYGDPALARIDAGRLVPLQGPIPIRDEGLEQRVAARAKEELGLSVGQRLFMQGDAAALFAARLDAWQGEVQGSRGKRFIQHEPLTPQLRSQQGVLELSFALAGAEGQTEASAEAVLRAWNEQQSLVPLLGGGWAPLPQAWLAQHAGLLSQVLQASAQAKPDSPQGPAHALPALAELCQVLDYPAPPSLQPFRALLQGVSELPPFELPAGLRAELRSYQRQGVNWLGLLQRTGMGALLADDMGLGKTLQTLCVLSGRSLVVCPTSVVHNWAAELSKFRPDLRYNIYHGKTRSLAEDAQVTITSYALLRLDLERLRQVRWDNVVLDEAQWIKNPESQVARAAFQLQAQFKLALSGTPVENRLDELWSQFHFTNPGLLGGRSEFQARYAEPIRQGNSASAAQLRQRIAPFILRRDKRTVAPELPLRTDLVVYCGLSAPEGPLYSAIRPATQQEIVEQLRQGGSVLQALEALLRLRQAACHPQLVPAGAGTLRAAAASSAASAPRPNAPADEAAETEEAAHAPSTSAKFNVLLETLEQAVAEGHKALVFSQWTSLLDLLEPELRRAQLRFSRLDGATRDREGVVNEFQSDGGPPVLLLSLKAGGTGLNLTAADHVFLMDPWWNPAVEQQAADRAHRMGQQRPVFVHRLVAKDTVEEKILALQQHKRDVAAAALQDAELASSLGREELLALLQ